MKMLGKLLAFNALSGFLLMANMNPASSSQRDLKYRAKFVRTYLAGVRLDPNQKDFLKFDPKAGYYLSSFSDGLGRVMLVKLALCPDPKWFGDAYPEGVRMKDISVAALPRLRSGKGVNIGDTPQQVRRKLGAASTSSKSNSKTRERTEFWQAPIRVKADGEWQNWSYLGTYVFRQNRLWAIEYSIIDTTENGED